MSMKPGNNDSKRQLAGALAATLGLVALACSDDDDDDDAMPGKGGSGGTGGKNGTAGSSSLAGKGGIAAGGEGGAPTTLSDADIEPMNALLAAEYNAITAYTAGAGLIDGADEEDPLYALRAVIVAVAVDIQSQHKLHAAALVDAIEALGGTPVSEEDVAAAFKPPAALVANPTITNVLKFATSAERGAAIAYNQVLAGLEDAKHRFIAASIEGDETQHFIVLAALVLGLASPGPNLSEETAADVIPQPFVSKVGAVAGLEMAPPDYFP
jgi:Ferritin-like domain